MTNAILLDEIREIDFFKNLKVHITHEQLYVLFDEHKYNPFQVQFSISLMGKSGPFDYTFRKKYSIIAQYYEKYYLKELKQLRWRNDINQFDTFIFGGEKRGLFDVNGEDRLKSYLMKYTGSTRSAKRIATQFEEDLICHIIPALDRLNNVHNLNEYANKPINKYFRDINWSIFRNSVFDKLIISRLSGDDSFHQIFELMYPLLVESSKRTNADEYQIWYPVILKKIYEELQDTKPLENPDLNSYKIDYDINEPYVLDCKSKES